MDPHAREAAAAPASAPAVWVRDDRGTALPAALVWALIVLMIVPDNFDYASLPASNPPASGSALSRLLWLGLLCGAALRVAQRAPLAWLLLRAINPFLAIFVALAVASLAWSLDPAVTARRLIRLFTILLVAFAAVLAGWHPRRFQALLRPVVTLMLGGSLAFGLLRPDLAIHNETSHELVGAWRGLTTHKNGLGALAGIGLILWYHAGLMREARPLAAWAGGLLAAACLLLSRSSTALMTALFAVLFLHLLHYSRGGLRPYLPYLIGLFAAVLLVYALAILQVVPGIGVLLRPFAALLGKDLTMTGRSDIWAIVAEHIRQHPFLGSGYGAYWRTPALGSPTYDFVSRLHFYPASAHNGYLDVLNDLGAAGLLCLAGFLMLYVRQAMCLAQFDFPQAGLYLALFLQQAVANLSESHWFGVLSVHFVLVGMASAALARTLLEYRLRLYFGDPDGLFGPYLDGTAAAEPPDERRA